MAFHRITAATFFQAAVTPLSYHVRYQLALAVDPI